MSLLGLDVGTTGVKAVAFDASGRPLASSYRGYPLSHPQPGFSEIENRLWWTAVEEVLREVNARVADDPVEALSTSAHGEAFCLVSKDGRELSELVVAFDKRAILQAARLEERLGRMAIYRLTGMSPHPMYTVAKLMWFAEHCPERMEQAWKALCVEDYVAWKLTGRAGISHSLASRTMAFDVRNRAWSAEMLAGAGLDAGLFAEPVVAGTVVERVGERQAAELGFKPNVLVAAGGFDQPCAALGAGIAGPGLAMNCTGTVDTLCAAIASPDFSEEMCSHNYALYPYVAEPHFATLAFNHGGGLSLSWFRSQLSSGDAEGDFYQTLFSRLPTTPGKVFFLPHLAGAGTSNNDPDSRAAFVGMDVSTTWADMARAVVDGLNCEMRFNLETLAHNGLRVSELRVTGGGAASDEWMRLKASCFGMPTRRLASSESGCLGCAILAGRAAGRFADAAEGIAAMVRLGDAFEPDPRQTALYCEKYERHKLLYPALRDFNRLLRD